MQNLNDIANHLFQTLAHAAKFGGLIKPKQRKEATLTVEVNGKPYRITLEEI